MAAKRGQAQESRRPVIRAFARGWVARKPEFARSMEGVAFCRLLVVGEAGPASAPPRVSLYVRGGEAERCAAGLREGDLIEAVGDIGPERPRARRQEVVVSERVKLWARATSGAGA